METSLVPNRGPTDDIVRRVARHSGIRRIVRADAWVSVASVLAIQGTFGLLTGYLWARYRNIWMPIAVHIVIHLVGT